MRQSVSFCVCVFLLFFLQKLCFINLSYTNFHFISEQYMHHNTCNAKIKKYQLESRANPEYHFFEQIAQIIDCFVLSRCPKIWFKMLFFILLGNPPPWISHWLRLDWTVISCPFSSNEWTNNLFILMLGLHFLYPFYMCMIVWEF